MGEFATVVVKRLRDAKDSLHRARAEGDVRGIEAHAADIENLHRLAAEHGVTLSGCGSGD